jgi:tetratricopeptide (TPR) repeat protein
MQLFGGLLLAGFLAGVVAPPAAWAQSASRLPLVGHSDAWRALEEHRYGDAAGLFASAARAEPGDAALWFGDGVAALMRGLNVQARTSFERALAIDSGLTDAAILLGQALYRNGQVAHAVAIYEQALVDAPDHPELVDALSRWQLEVVTEAPFDTLRGPHFEIRHLPSDGNLAARALEVLEARHARLGAELGISDLRRIEVVLYSKEQFKAVTKLPAWAVGIYDGRIKVPLGGGSPSVPDLTRVLEHELVHAIVAAVAGPTVPAWLNEGLATALERDGGAWAEEVGGPSASIPVAGLPRGFRTLMPAEARVAYRASTLAVRRLLDQHGLAAVVRVLRGIGRGLPFDEAFHDGIGVGYETFASEAPR